MSAPRHSARATTHRPTRRIAAWATSLALAMTTVGAGAMAANAEPINTGSGSPDQQTCAAQLGGVGAIDMTGGPDSSFSAPLPIDKNVNVYVGGNFESTAGAELEGRLVVDGDATVDTSGMGNQGRVGAGSGLTPEPGTAMMRVGGNLTLDRSLDSSTWTSTTDTTPAAGTVEVGGSVSGSGSITPSTVNAGLGKDAALGSPSFSEWPNDDFSVLSTIADNDWAAGTDGSAQWSGSTLTLSGAAGANYHRFTLDADDLPSGGFTLNIDSSTIDPTDPIVIKVTGSGAANLAVSSTAVDGSGLVMFNKRFGQLASQILWEVPDSSDVTIGGGQFPGSVLVLNKNSTTTQNAGGSNGRVWVAGNLVHDHAGSEFHAYPFIGDNDMVCGQPPTPPASSITKVVPGNPGVEQARCDGSDVVDPTVTPAATEGITYTVDNDSPKAGDTVTVTASPADDSHAIDADNLPDGWSYNEDDGTATYTVTLDQVDCTPDVAPVTPDVAQATCDENGSPVAPTVTPAETDGITYGDPDVSENEDGTYTVTVTASPADDSHSIDGSNLPDGWELNEDGTATYTTQVDAPDCVTPVAPVNPEVGHATCDENGNPVGPTVTPADTDGIEYDSDVSKNDDGSYTVTVTASPADDSHSVDLNNLPDGWTPNENDGAIYTTQVNAPDCVTPVAPETPTVKQATCDGATVVDPTITPATTEGIDYTVDNDSPKAGDTVTVTATPKDDYSLDGDNLPDGWTLNEDGTATYKVTLDDVDCVTPVAPENPEITQPRCDDDGNTVAPTATPAETDGITYGDPDVSENEDGSYTVTVTATPSDDSHSIDGDNLPDGWKLNDDGTATYQVTLDPIDCVTPVAPETPTVKQATCDGATVVDPTITPATTEGIDYTADNDSPKAGDTVLVTATPKDGYTIDSDSLPKGWELNEDGTATYQVTLDQVDCTPTAVAPVTPDMSHATCDGDGNPIAPTVTPAETDGITYGDPDVSKNDDGTYTVSVTASPADDSHSIDGSNLPDGWELNEDGTATYTQQVDAPDCVTPVAPVNPEVGHATCDENGSPVGPTVAPATTDGIAYGDPDVIENEDGTYTVTVTASPADDSYSLDGDNLTDGWKLNEDETATYTTQVDAPDCVTPVAPKTPTVKQATCDGATVVDPTITPATTEGIDYTVDNDSPKAGDTVTVTATPQDGYTLDGSDGWKLNEDGTATYQVTLDQVDCTPMAVTPETPDVTQPRCGDDGNPVDPAVTPAETDGITYGDPDVSENEDGTFTVTVTATPTDGYTIDGSDLTDGWKLNEDGTATYTQQVDAPDCSTPTPTEKPVAPTDPKVVTPEKCTDDPSLKFQDNEGVKYTVEGDYKAGETVTVTAHAADGYTLKSAEGWTVAKDGKTATWKYTFAASDCGPVDPGIHADKPGSGTASDGSTPLADTGSDLLLPGALAVALLGLGGVLMLVRRRKALSDKA